MDWCQPLPSLNATPNVEVYVLQQDATHRVPGYVLQARGTPSSCLNDFPLRVQGRTGWWRLLSQIELDVAPHEG